jgi:hypothetical protein
MQNNDFFSNNNAIDLSSFDSDYEAAPSENPDREDVPDGKYQVRIERAELIRAHTSGNPMLKWTLRILAPDHVGRFLWKNSLIASAENVKYLKIDLTTCGLRLAKLSDLQANLGQLINIVLEVTKRSKGESASIFFNRKIEIADVVEGDAGDLVF